VICYKNMAASLKGRVALITGSFSPLNRVCDLFDQYLSSKFQNKSVAVSVIVRLYTNKNTPRRFFEGDGLLYTRSCLNSIPVSKLQECDYLLKDRK
jgi:hypothetical protein